MRANVSRVSSFYMQGEKGTILFLARGQFAGQNLRTWVQYEALTAL